MNQPDNRILSHGELLQLKRWNTPTIYNGWEKVTSHNAAADGFNTETLNDFMPQMGPMVGYAVTLVVQPSNPEHKQKNPDALEQYLDYMTSIPGPKIVVVQDLDKPAIYGSLWGEVCSNIHKAFGCVGTITDGPIRDVDEMTNAGFKALARTLCVGHAHVCPIRWNCPVEVFGSKIIPGQLIHADKHGFLAIPPGEEKSLVQAAAFMDQQECRFLISTMRETTGLTNTEIRKKFKLALNDFLTTVHDQFARKGEW